MPSIKVLDKEFVPYISEEKLQQRVRELASDINRDFKDKKPLFICILSGSFLFSADLFRHITLESEIHFIKLKSYTGTESSGTVTTALGISFDIRDKDVIIIEDIVDTGKTLHSFIPQLMKLNCHSISIVTLLRKPDALKFPLDCDYVGFDIDNKFVVGYGLDYDEMGRNIPCIYQLKI